MPKNNVAGNSGMPLSANLEAFWYRDFWNCEDLGSHFLKKYLNLKVTNLNKWPRTQKWRRRKEARILSAS